MTEHDEQVKLFQWAKMYEHRYPGLQLLYANPLGGKRPKRTASKMKQEGAKAGVPDLTLPVPANGYHGMYIEMKYGKNKPTEAQQWWLDRLTAEGYKTVVAYGWEEAADAICDYLGMEWPYGLPEL